MRLSVWMLLCVLSACMSPNQRNSPHEEMNQKKIVESLLITPDPDGHRAFISALQNTKTHQVRLMMYHLTDPAVVEALIQAAKRPGTDVRVILDRSSLESDPKRKAIFDKLSQSLVKVRPSSPAFSITHAKSMLINDELAFITAINLTENAATTRDFGITTLDSNIIQEMKKVFDSDWEQFESSQASTPDLKNEFLVWSPVNSQKKLSDLILGSKSQGEILATVENLNDPVIQAAFEKMARSGHHVRLLIPECDKNKNPVYNYKYALEMSRQGVEVRVMPYPATTRTPYMHSKMILVDSSRAYVGSVNFSGHSTLHSRELGVIFSDAGPVAEIKKNFELDWEHSKTRQDPPPTYCPAVLN